RPTINAMVYTSLAATTQGVFQTIFVANELHVHQRPCAIQQGNNHTTDRKHLTIYRFFGTADRALVFRKTFPG
ncbi:hypothetical protein, partial [Aeromonas veronii]|uniref:hypothetical protein n=1 Tax=Aeromonas veronii TaxID=654 RepID=UPI0038B69118